MTIIGFVHFSGQVPLKGGNLLNKEKIYIFTFYFVFDCFHDAFKNINFIRTLYELYKLFSTDAK